MTIEQVLSTGMGYVQTGLSFIREWVGKIIGFTGFSAELGTIISMLIVSVILARLVAKRFVTKPYSGMYFIPTIIITLLIFIILMYL